MGRVSVLTSDPLREVQPGGLRVFPVDMYLGGASP